MIVNILEMVTFYFTPCHITQSSYNEVGLQHMFVCFVCYKDIASENGTASEVLQEPTKLNTKVGTLRHGRIV